MIRQPQEPNRYTHSAAGICPRLQTSWICPPQEFAILTRCKQTDRKQTQRIAHYVCTLFIWKHIRPANKACQHVWREIYWHKLGGGLNSTQCIHITLSSGFCGKHSGFNFRMKRRVFLPVDRLSTVNLVEVRWPRRVLHSRKWCRVRAAP
jgi:hypothetical protein